MRGYEERNSGLSRFLIAFFVFLEFQGPGAVYKRAGVGLKGVQKS